MSAIDAKWAVERLTPRILPAVTATIPPKKDPRARDRTENHTASVSIIPEARPGSLTGKISEEYGFRKDSLSNE